MIGPSSLSVYVLAGAILINALLRSLGIRAMYYNVRQALIDATREVKSERSDSE